MQYRLLSALPLLVLTSGCAAHRVPPRATLVDLSPKFLSFYDSAVAGQLDAEARWSLWKARYGFAAVPPIPFGDSLARRLLDSAWTRYPGALPRIRTGAAALGISPERELHRVIGLLGCGSETKVKVVVFVGGFEDNAFAYSSADGTPTIALPLEAGDASRSLVHELTHAVHRSSGCADIKSGYGQSLAELVLSEGVAMRVVERLLPGHGASYYTNAAPGWLDSANARRAAILRGVREHLTESGGVIAQKFTFGRGTTGLPREAYYAGWEIIGALLRGGMSLHDIATTRPDGIAALVLRGIDALEPESAR